MEAVRQILSNFHIGAASGWDIFLIVILLIAVLIYGIFLGKNRMIVLLLSSYFSWSILKVMPWQSLSRFGWLGIGQTPSTSLRTIVFLAIILLFYFLIPRSVLSSTLRIRKRGDASWIQLFIISIVQVGFLAMVILSFLPEQVIDGLGSLIQKTFTGPGAQFIWVALPVLTIVLMKRRKKEDK